MINEWQLKRYLPGWMLDRTHWRNLMRGTLNVVDKYDDYIRWARLAAFPNQTNLPNYGGFESTDSLALHGRDRGILQGKLETFYDYAARLRDFRNAWNLSGTYVGLLYALRGTLTPTPPTVRVVRGGLSTAEAHWWTLNDEGLRYQETGPGGEHNGVFWPGGLFGGGVPVPDSTNAVGFDWDSATWPGIPAVNPDPTRCFVFIDAPTNAPYLDAVEGSWGTADGSEYLDKTQFPDPLTLGTVAPLSYVETAKAVCERFKTAGIIIPYIIVDFTAEFGPNGGPNMPEGTWKYHHKYDGSDCVYARSDRARYWSCTPTVDVDDPYQIA